MKHFLFTLPFFLWACSHGEPALDSAAGAPAPMRALAPVKVPEAEGQPHTDFTWKQRSFRVGYGPVRKKSEGEDWNRMYGFGPVVWVTDPAGTRTLDLREEFPAHLVSYVHQAERTHRIYLFLEYAVEGPSDSYQVLFSEDGGDHWLRGADLKRPGAFPAPEIASFSVDRTGRGAAVFGRGKKAVRVETRDGGRSWQAPAEARRGSV